MNNDDVIEQAARFACTARPGHDHQPRLDQECAWVLAVCENLADAGLLARPLPDREQIAAAILEAELWHRPPGIGGQVVPAVGDRHLAVADAVLDLLKGQDR